MRQLLDNKVSPTSQQIKCILSVNVREKLSELVQRRLRELDLSKAELARKVGVSRSYIGNIANETAPTQSGQYNLSPETVASLAKALEIAETEILAAMNYLSNGQKESPIPISDFDGTDADDIKKIRDYIAFVKSQKNKL